ncbi:unannotated protein [freshwater metagenome]|uniref:Unannotated protein n=1 Tax=freshwater metagenome TaxID=449393 RepID=A0A6J6BEE3_9ZZZZ
MGVLLPCAETTIAVMRASSVSLPTRVARTIILPLLFIADPMTREPGATSTGVDSPVIIELFTELWPEITIPSVAIRAPGFTMNSSPMLSSVTGMRVSMPARITVTSFSPSANKVESALLALFFARDSRYLPRMTKKRTPAATSVYTSPSPE